MKKTSKEYAEKLANEYAVQSCGPYHEFQPLRDLGIEDSLLEITSNDFKEGYLKACEENNVEGLREALEEARNSIYAIEFEKAFKYYGGNVDAEKIAYRVAETMVSNLDKALNKVK